MRHHSISLCAAALASAASASLQIVPGATWTASNSGEHIQAHGAGVLEVDGTFYMIGEDKSGGSSFQNINCYSSTNLVEWKYERALLTKQDSGDLGPDRVVERPKVIYNDSTKKYVLWMHIDDSSYGEAKTGVATGDTVCGEYEYQGSFQPLGFQSRDIGLFKDDDGSAYLLTEDRENGLRIDALSDDYLNVTENVALFDTYEAPAIYKTDGTYFLFASSLSGWDPNDNVYATATSLSGPWSDWANFADKGSNTYSSQTTYILPLGTSAIYMGDRWHSSALETSTYVWLPLEIDGTSASMKNHVNWVVDAAGGTWAAGPEETQAEGEDAELSSGAKAVDCEGCSGGQAAGYIGGSGGGTASFNVSSQKDTRTTVRIKYKNGDGASRHASVAGQTVAFLPTSGEPGSSVVHLDLKAGENSVLVEGVEGGEWGPDVDRLMVPVS
ncbi:carbohydrate-binding module family 35 protein [Aplosporella prunicola CBS 121167]|uniref:Carbohydrate-binding module family 35 protein n=1 Tax=Aplosporella prunicola CBS 121167 TaxID=1176127 RepID=A0A6A6B3G7_9PEZI|nr:carbohydrate-binding module family 35 protein [Aplosporella prunicola CBS 121167]KAF2137913.1 carbohydrate-binding module family 35 protein [Aplosporella prunicola CBS 121167]